MGTLVAIGYPAQGTTEQARQTWSGPHCPMRTPSVCRTPCSPRLQQAPDCQVADDWLPAWSAGSKFSPPSWWLAEQARGSRPRHGL